MQPRLPASRARGSNPAFLFPSAQDATVYVGGLDEKVSEPLLWELFLQAGPVVNTHMPKDRVTGQHQGGIFTALS